MKMINKDLEKKVERCIEELRQEFIEICKAKNNNEQLPFHFFRERWLHYLFYKILKEEIREPYKIRWEYPTEKRYSDTGRKRKKGNNDLTILDGSGKKVLFGFEFYLGYEHSINNSTEVKKWTINPKNFCAHLRKDIKRLESVERGYILNFFYKGKIIRRSVNRERKREETYKKHLQNFREKIKDENANLKSQGKAIKILMFEGECRD